MNPRIKAFLYLHVAVFLWGFTAILGKLISYGSINLVWHRMLLTAAIYFCIPAFWRHLKQLNAKEILTFLGIGGIVCAHWLTFYGSIKLGNSASITLACLGTASFFSAVLEPLITKQSFKKIELLLGLLVVGGILLVYVSIPENSKPGIEYPLAIVTGVASAFLAALFTVLNKHNIHKANPLALSALEMLSGAVLLTLVMIFATPAEGFVLPQWDPSSNNYDLLWIFLLVVLCTNLTFWLGSMALQELSAFTANLTVNLEPVYGIILGAVIFHEHEKLNFWFYAGALLILISVFAQSFVDYYHRRNKKEPHSELLIRE